MFDLESQKSVIVESLMHKPPETVSPGDHMQEVMSEVRKDRCMESTCY